MHRELRPAVLASAPLSAFMLAMTAFGAGPARDFVPPGTAPKPPYVHFPAPPEQRVAMNARWRE
jgi:hypothetical protein